MKRIQLFEFEDLHWFPGWLRDSITSFIVPVHKTLGTPKLIAPLVARVAKATKANSIVDLCSGGGGPMLDVLKLLEADHGFSGSLTLTDLHPNKNAARHVEASLKKASYCLAPVDAGNVPETLNGIRTMVCSFHHMPPPVASAILSDAFKKKAPLIIFELSDNSTPKALWWTAIPAGFLLALVLIPFTRGFSLRHFILTYIFPLLPALIAWDGAASNARTYPKSDLEILIKPLVDPHYGWEIGTIEKRGYPSRFLYLVGMPGI